MGIAASTTLLSLALLSGLFSAASAQNGDASTVGQWSGVKPWPAVAVHAHLLPTGKVMYYSYGDDSRSWDPANDAITQLALAGYNIFCTGHSLLGDGRLLVTGGHISNNIGERRATLYDPSTNKWTNQPDMNAGRWYPTNTALANGDVLVVSGSDEQGRMNPLPQVWQAGNGRWRSLTSATRDLPYYPFMYGWNGKVFNAGPNQDTQYLDTSGTGAWTNVGLRKFGFRDYGSSVMYDDGKVLVVGGADPPTPTAEVIDLNAASPAWSDAARMANPRRQLNATLLPDGKVLATGGSSAAGFSEPSGAVHAAEMWDPATDSWTTLASSTRFRGYHSIALLLPDGRVLSAGGDNEPNAEIFSPPYLFKGSRPTVTSAPASVSYGQTFSVATPDAASVAKVTWVRLSSVTHAFNMNQRINVLSFSQAAGGLNVTAPANGNASPPGHYMLFVLNGNGVPSVAKIVQLVAASSAAPAAPTSLTATAASSSQVNLRWTDTSDNEDGFKIERCQGAGCTTFAQIAQVGPNASSYSDSGLAAGTTYGYRVRAFNSAGDSGYSSPASAATPAGTGAPAAPTSLTATAASVSRIDLAWAHNSSDEDGFAIERSSDSTTFAEIARVGAGATTYSDAAVPQANRWYYYRVRAYSGTAVSAYSNTARARTPRR